ncbi:hypothetical protein ANDA3_0601 [plant metagenome]|uniref:Uncharacterized protein n=2 Tax=root TaxID=1 RepID=A0A1C3K2I1_9BURK|nr:hypothetical protein [Orrella dioscoreae]SBT25615.1 hypothetical protein ODI_03543 [Orrella dioscoreae]SOE47022.1 hypothetical protein ODI_R0601 [Orrella dioscoreae]
MSRRIAAGQAAASFAPEHAQLRQTQGRRTQLRLLARRRQAMRLHDDLLIRDAQHGIPHATVADDRRTRRRELLARLSARRAQAAGAGDTQAPPPVPSAAPSEPGATPPETPRPQDLAAWRDAPPPAADTGGRAPLAVGERNARQQAGHQDDADERREGAGAEPATGAGRRRTIAVGRARAAAPLRQAGDLQQFLWAHHRDALTALPMMADAWARALLHAIDSAGASRSCVDAALACQEDLLAAWARHGERLEVKQGALLQAFLPALRDHAPAPDGGAGRPYALLPLLMISGLRPRTPTQLRETRTRVRNQRLARLPPKER